MITVPIAGRPVAITETRNDAGAITRISADGTDPIRSGCVRAVDAWLGKGVPLQDQALRVAAMAELIAGLIRA